MKTPSYPIVALSGLALIWEPTYGNGISPERVIAQEAYLKAANPGAGDNFGRSVAVSGDTVVVGAP